MALNSLVGVPTGKTVKYSINCVIYHLYWNLVVPRFADQLQFYKLVSTSVSIN